MQEYMNYEEYRLSMKEEAECLLMAAVLTGIAAWVLYQSIWGSFLILLVFPLCRVCYREEKKEKRMYKTGKYDRPNINSEQDILMNLDNMFNVQKQKRLGLPYRGEYNITFIGNDILRYKSDLPITDKSTLLEIIETPPIDTTHMTFRDDTTEYTEDFVKLYGDVTNIHWGNLETLGLVSAKAIIDKPKEFSTHTEIILIDNKGIILGTCNNSGSTIKKLDDVIQELYVMSLLESTSIF